MAQKMAKTVPFACVSLIASFFLQTHPTSALPSPIRPSYGSKAPLLELCVDLSAPLALGNVAFSVTTSSPPCWSYSPFPSNTVSSGAAVPGDVQASQPTLTITIPSMSGNIPQLAPQAFRPTESGQAKSGQRTQDQFQTDHGVKEEALMTTFVVPNHQYGTPTMPPMSAETITHMLTLEGGASLSVSHVDQPGEATSIRDSPSQVALPLGARVALGIVVPVVLTGILALVWMFHRRRSQRSINIPAEEAGGHGTDKKETGVHQSPAYPPSNNIQYPETDPEKMDKSVLSVAHVPSQTLDGLSKMASTSSLSVSEHVRPPGLDVHEPIAGALGIDHAPPLGTQPSLVHEGIVNFSRPLRALKSPLSTTAMKMPPTPKLTPKILRTPKTPNFSLSLPRTTVHYPGNRQVVATPGSYRTPTITKRRFSPQGVVLYSTGDPTLSPKADYSVSGGRSITGESIIAAYEANTEPSTPKKRLTSFMADLSPSKLLARRVTLSPIISMFSPKLGSPEVMKVPIKPLHLRKKKVVKPPPAAVSRTSRVDDNDPGFSQFLQGVIAHNKAYHAIRTRAIQEAEEKENHPVLDENSSSGLGPLLPPLSLGLNLMAGSSTSTLPSLMSDSGSTFEADRRI